VRSSSSIILECIFGMKMAQDKSRVFPIKGNDGKRPFHILLCNSLKKKVHNVGRKGIPAEIWQEV
jgi:hypothetical protein